MPGVCRHRSQQVNRARTEGGWRRAPAAGSTESQRCRRVFFHRLEQATRRHPGADTLSGDEPGLDPAPVTRPAGMRYRARRRSLDA
ncbi:MAG TPA: hypothetical protein VNS49_05890 [Streptomyces sp.]|nr:hypothetical protein [Streptomyces sp.]